MKLKMVLFLVSVFPCLFAMDETQEPAVLVLPADVIKLIIQHPAFGQNLPEITHNLRVLAHTNKRFNSFINDPKITQEIINNLASRFKVSPMAVMVDLRTRAANQLLVEDKNKPKLSQDLMGYLLDASEQGNSGKIKFLLPHIPTELINSGLNYSALHKAAAKGHLKSVELLLAAGANPNRRETWEKTALMEAAFNGHVAIAQRLLQAGADAWSKDRGGYNAFWYATQSKGSMGCSVPVSMDHTGVNQQAMLDLLKGYADWKQRWFSWIGY